MSEIKLVKLSSLRPSPYRDAEKFPLRPERVARLRESIEAEGFWEGVIARPADGGYEIAFGNHRVEAGRQALGEDAKVPIIIRDLSDVDMLRFMMRENLDGEGLGHCYTTGQIVNAAVVGLGRGAFGRGDGPEEWPEEDPKAKAEYLRVAPSFWQGSAAAGGDRSQVWTVQTLAEFVEKVKKEDSLKGSRREAKSGYRLAADFLGLIEIGAATFKQWSDLGDQLTKIEAFIQLTRGASRVRDEALTAETSVLVAARKRAEQAKDKDGAVKPDLNEIEKLNSRLADIEEKTKKAVAHAAKATASQVAQLFAKGESIRSVKESLAPEIARKNAAKVKKTKRGVRVEFTYEDKQALIRHLDESLTDDSPEWSKALHSAGNKQIDKDLLVALKQLAARAKLRAGEYEKAMNAEEKGK